MALSYRIQFAEALADRGETSAALEQLYKALDWYESSHDRVAMLEVLDRIVSLDPEDGDAAQRFAELTRQTPYR